MREDKQMDKTQFSSDQDVRWCPGCGDFAILAQMKKVLPDLGVPPENIVFVSGIGCSSRFPYYLNTYGIHGIHGRAPAIATGLKRIRPDLQVWVITGDGDALSIGCTHLMHALRRNVDIKVLLFNNRIYGLTKGQFSPTSPPGLVTGSTPYGTVFEPLHPLSVALSSQATFVARSIDTYTDHLSEVLARAARHRGSAFVEIYQNCHIFNDGTFDHARDTQRRPDHVVRLEHDSPLIFGRDRTRGLYLDGLTPRTAEWAADAQPPDDLIVHDERADDPALAYILARMAYPELPEAIGVLRAVERPTHDSLLDAIDTGASSPPPTDLKEEDQELMTLLRSGEIWTVNYAKNG